MEPEVVAVSSSQVLRIRRPGEEILGRIVAFSRGVAFGEEARVDSHETIHGERGWQTPEMRGLRRSSGPVANFGSCDQDLFVPTGSEACGNTRGACFLNLPYRQDFMYCLWAWTLEPECLDLSPRTVLGWFLESRFWLGGMFIGACAEVYNTCEGVKEVRWGRRRRWSRYDGSQGLCWSPWELWSWADPSELPCVEVREPGLSAPYQPAVRWGLSLDRAVTLAQVTLRSKTELSIISYPTFPPGKPLLREGEIWVEQPGPQVRTAPALHLGLPPLIPRLLSELMNVKCLEGSVAHGENDLLVIIITHDFISFTFPL